MNKLGIAVVGCGRMGRMHVDSIQKYNHYFDLKAVVDRDLDRGWVDSRHIPLASDSIESILNERSIDAVLIATSSTEHVKLVEQAVNAGKHVFCEKPVSFELNAFDKLISLVSKSNCKVQVGYNRRFDPDFKLLQTKLREGVIGKPHIIKITNRDPKRPDINFVKNSGGLFLDFNAHDFDMIHFLTGSRVRKIAAMGSVMIQKELKEYNDIDTALISLQLEDGSLCVIDASRETNFGYDQRIEILGERGMLKVDNLRDNHVEILNEDGCHASQIPYSFVERYRQAYIDQLSGFAEAIRDDKPVIVGLAEARASIEVAIAAGEALANQAIRELG